MKNLMMMIVVIFLFGTFLNAAPAKETKKETAYTCPGDEGDCLTFKGNGDIWITVHGVLTVTTVEVPTNGLVPEPGPGGEEINNFFLYTDHPSTTTGKGYINGCLHFYGENTEFNVFEIDEQTIYEDYYIWEQNVQ